VFDFTNSLFKSKKRTNSLLMLCICAIFIATGSQFYPLFVAVFLLTTLVWVLFCRVGIFLGHFCGKIGKKKGESFTKLHRFQSGIMQILARLLALSLITEQLLVANVRLMGVARGANWEAIVLVLSCLFGIPMGEKINRDIERARARKITSHVKPEPESVSVEKHIDGIQDILPSIHELKDALKEPDSITRLWAINELKRIGNKEALMTLESMIDDEDRNISLSARQAADEITRRLIR